MRSKKYSETYMPYRSQKVEFELRTHFARSTRTTWNDRYSQIMLKGYIICVRECVYVQRREKEWVIVNWEVSIY